MRAFLAVPSDPEWGASAREFVARLRPRLPQASWTRPESWHLTLRFLGEVPDEAAEQFSQGLTAAMPVFEEGELAPGGPVVFPPRGRPRVLGIGFAPGRGADALALLAEASEKAARSIGCPPEDRPFRPHLTFARLRETWPSASVEEFRSAAGGWRFPPWHVRSMVLYSSRLDPAGAVHTPVREWRAAGSRAGASA